MADFRIIYYILIVMFAALIGVFSWGWITFNQIKSTEKFYNKPLITLTMAIGSIGFLFTFMPIFLQIWNYTADDVKSNPMFISFLVVELVFLISFLVLAYIFAFDFGITLDNDGKQLGFFGQVVSSKKIVAVEEKKKCIKIVYEQGFKNLKKKLIILSPNAKQYAMNILAPVVATNLENRKNMEKDEEKHDNQTANPILTPANSPQVENTIPDVNEKTDTPKPENDNSTKTKIENNE